MGHSEDLENQLNNEALKPRTDLADQAVFEAQERIREELKEIFGETSVKEMEPAMLIRINELIRNYGDPFPKEIMLKAARKFAEEDPLYNPKKPFGGLETTREHMNPSEKVFDQLTYRPENFTPEEKQEFLENLILSHSDILKNMITENPNGYYSEDMIPSKEEGTASAETISPAGMH